MADGADDAQPRLVVILQVVVQALRRVRLALRCSVAVCGRQRVLLIAEFNGHDEQERDDSFTLFLLFFTHKSRL